MSFVAYYLPAYEVRGKIIFILGNVCLFTLAGGTPFPGQDGGPHPDDGWGVLHSQIRTGGYPIPGLDGGGYPIPISGQEGYLIPGLDRGYSIPGPNRGRYLHARSGRGGYPGVAPVQVRSQVRMEGILGYPPTQDWMDTSHPVLDALTTRRVVCLLR